MDRYPWISFYNPSMQSFNFQNQHLYYYPMCFLNLQNLQAHTYQNYSNFFQNVNFPRQKQMNSILNPDNTILSQKIVQNLSKDKDNTNSILFKSQVQKQLNQLDKSHINNKKYRFNENIKNIKIKRQKLKSKNKYIDIQYQPSEDEQQKNKVKKISDTKNVIRNFSRGMISLIFKHKRYIKDVIKKCNLNENQFYDYIQSLKGKISNIVQLRQIWGQNNKFGKAMRIISFNYLRKHFISRAFNSKIRMIERNIKYKQKLERGLKYPSQFTSMKYKFS